MTGKLTIRKKFHIKNGCHGRKTLQEGPVPAAKPKPGRVPRVARLLALAHSFDRLIRTKEVRDQAELARLGHVSRARVTQIMSLLFLAPDIQEQVLFLPRVTAGRDPIRERAIRPITAIPDWKIQRKAWRRFTAP